MESSNTGHAAYTKYEGLLASPRSPPNVRILFTLGPSGLLRLEAVP